MWPLGTTTARQSGNFCSTRPPRSPRGHSGGSWALQRIWRRTRIDAALKDHAELHGTLNQPAVRLEPSTEQMRVEFRSPAMGGLITEACNAVFNERIAHIGAEMDKVKSIFEQHEKT